MINLLPDGIKKDIAYARNNTMLRHWIGLFLMAILGVAVITVFGLFYINQNINSLSKQNAVTRQELEDQKITSVQKQVKDISNNLKLTVQVLSREILFSELIKQIGTVMPSKDILTGLDITKVQGGIDLTALAEDYSSATQLQINLQDPHNKIFDKADIISIICSKNSKTQTSNANYPCTVVIRAQFSKNNPFLFINSQVKS